MSGAATAGADMIMACIAAGTKTTPMSVVTVKAGTIVTTAAVAGVTVAEDAVVTAINRAGLNRYIRRGFSAP